MSRLREQFIDDPIVGHHRVFRDDGSLYSSVFQAGSRRSVHRLFTDVPGTPNKVKPCSSESLTLVNNPRPPVLPPNPTSGEWFETNSNWFGGGATTSAVRDLFPFPSSPVRAAMADNAYDALWPQIPQEVSIPNFIYELRELGSMIPSLEKSITQTVAGGYLTYSFGWKPFVADVKAIVGLMDTIRTRLEYLRDTWGRETRVSYSEKFDIEVGTPSVNSSGFERLSFQGTFTCGGYLFHMLQDLNGLIGEMRALTAATGFNNPLGVIWETIPFSFVADWFSRAGKVISRTPVQPFVGPWEIHRLTHSYKFGGTVRFREIFPPQLRSSDWIISEGVYERYERDIGLPVPSTLLTGDGLSPQQQALGAALLAGSGHH